VASAELGGVTACMFGANVVVSPVDAPLKHTPV
jgi:hypothetical protein